MDRSSHVLQDQIGEGDIFIARSGVALKFNWTAVNLIENTVGDRDVLGKAATKTKHRPAGAEDTVRDGDELAASKQCAGIIL